MDENQSEKNQLTCDQCQREIAFGGDVIRAERCVSGPRGVIPLGEALHFCSESCASNFFDHDSAGNLQEISPRIP